MASLALTEYPLAKTYFPLPRVIMGLLSRRGPILSGPISHPFHLVVKALQILDYYPLPLSMLPRQQRLILLCHGDWRTPPHALNIRYLDLLDT